jgi:pyridoxal phosphate enzyme (YggS family)
VGIPENIALIRERIEAACTRAGRKSAEVRLMGVSKFQSLAAVEAAWGAGIRLFGENRVQEAVEKFAGFSGRHPGTELHLIGALQRNKVKTACSLFDGIQSVDRDELIVELGKVAAIRGSRFPVLLELNAGEESKSGYRDLDTLLSGAERLLTQRALLPAGLMTIAPLAGGEGETRRAFRSLKAAQRQLEARFPGNDWSCLSMGMSGDFEIAIEEGSSLVRIGTALFGARNP